jgi:hypothetical protein
VVYTKYQFQDALSSLVKDSALLADFELHSKAQVVIDKSRTATVNLNFNVIYASFSGWM